MVVFEEKIFIAPVGHQCRPTNTLGGTRMAVSTRCLALANTSPSKTSRDGRFELQRTYDLLDQGSPGAPFEKDHAIEHEKIGNLAWLATIDEDGW